MWLFPSSLNPFSLWWIYSPFDEIWILKRLIGHLPFWLTFAPPMQFWKRQSAVKGVNDWTITGNHKQKRSTELEMSPGFISLSSPCKNLTEIWAISPRLFFVKMLEVLHSFQCDSALSRQVFCWHTCVKEIQSVDFLRLTTERNRQSKVDLYDVSPGRMLAIWLFALVWLSVVYGVFLMQPLVALL